MELVTNVKKRVLSVVSELPDTCSYESIIYQLYVMQKFDAGLADLNKGKFLTEEQIAVEHQRWLE